MIFSNRFFLCYVAAVTSATLTNVFLGFPFSNFVILSSDHLRYDLLFTCVGIGFTYCIVTAFTSLLPCVLTEIIANKIQRRPWSLFVFGGLVTGLALGPFFTSLSPGLATDSGPPTSLFWIVRYPIAFKNDGLEFSASGACGGLVYWWLIRKWKYSNSLTLK